METFYFFILQLFSRWFKSYYVVWKPENENDENDENDMFKSYYVVWKQKKAKKNSEKKESLNRTM